MGNVRERSFRGYIKRASAPLITLVALWSASTAHAYDYVVAQDGSGGYATVQAAIDAVPDHVPGRTTIYVKAGTYNEKVVVPDTKRRITLLGEDRDTTIITNDGYNVSATEDLTDTPTFYVRAKNFGARNISFVNTAGDVGQGALALWVEGNRAHFRHCAFLGFQDTLYTTGASVYFSKCYIEGAIDYIFGNSDAVFDHCTMHSIGHGYITATYHEAGKDIGFVFLNCTVAGEAEAGTVHLGRPLEEDTSVVYVNCDLDDEIAPVGWEDFDDYGADGLEFFAEYNSTGPGANPADRAAWSHQLTAQEAAAYTVENLLPASTAIDSQGATKPWYDAY